MPTVATISPRYLRSRDLVHRLGVSRETLRRMVARGELRALQPGSKWRYYDAEDVERILNDNAK